MKCSLCKDTGMVLKNNLWVECECTLKRRWRQKLSDFLPAPTSTSTVRNQVETAIKAKPPKKILVPKMTNDLHKPFFIHYLLSGNLLNDFKVLNSYYLIELYVGNVENESMYEYTHGTLILLHGFSDIKNKQEVNIMTQFVDHYKDRDILIYSNTKDTSELKAGLLTKGFKIL